jgi:hypothetical protein
MSALGGDEVSNKQYLHRAVEPSEATGLDMFPLEEGRTKGIMTGDKRVNAGIASNSS